jgi:hypothetical protein
MKNKTKIDAGAVIAVPVKEYFVIGLITRKRKNIIILCEFFFKANDLNIDFENIYKCKYEKHVFMTGVLGFKTEGWIVIGNLPNWSQSEWPIPDFFRHTEPSVPKLISYNDNLDEIYSRETLKINKKLYPSDGLYGVALVQSILERLFP